MAAVGRKGGLRPQGQVLALTPQHAALSCGKEPLGAPSSRVSLRAQQDCDPICQVSYRGCCTELHMGETAAQRAPRGRNPEWGPYLGLQPSPRPCCCLKSRPLHLPTSGPASRPGTHLSPLLSLPACPPRPLHWPASWIISSAPASSSPEFHLRDSQGTGSPSCSSSATGPVPALDTPPMS